MYYNFILCTICGYIIIYPNLLCFEIGFIYASFIIRSLGKLIFSFISVRSFCIHNSSLVVSGLLTGLVIDSGDGVTHVVIN